MKFPSARVQVRDLDVYTTGEESVGQDYEQDRLIGLDHE